MQTSDLLTLDGLIKKYNEGEIGVSYAHGIMTALLSSPDPIMPSAAYPFIIGDGEEMAEFESEEEMDQFFRLCISLNNEIAQDLHEKSPQVLLSIEEQERYRPDEAAEWCLGYVEGVLLWPNKVLEEGTEEEMTHFIPFTMLSDPEAFFEGAEESEEEIEQVLKDCTENLEKFAALVHYYYHPEEGEEQADEEKKKIGRNDPCPCGSGKKYKKCCGA